MVVMVRLLHVGDVSPQLKQESISPSLAAPFEVSYNQTKYDIYDLLKVLVIYGAVKVHSRFRNTLLHPVLKVNNFLTCRHQLFFSITGKYFCISQVNL